MSSIIEKVTVTGAGLTLARLIWNRFHLPVDGLLGRIYDLNPGLSDLGIEIPIGTVILIPVDEDPSGTGVVEQVTLWD